MTIDKFGRNLTHPYHLSRKLKKSPEVVREVQTKQLYGFMHMTLSGSVDSSGNCMIHGQPFYKFPLKSGTIEYVNVHPQDVRTTINKQPYTMLLLKKLKFSDKISFSTKSNSTVLFVEFLIKYPIE